MSKKCSSLHHITSHYNNVVILKSTVRRDISVPSSIKKGLDHRIILVGYFGEPFEGKSYDREAGNDSRSFRPRFAVSWHFVATPSFIDGTDALLPPIILGLPSNIPTSALFVAQLHFSAHQ